MRGYPKNLNTREDYEFVKKEFPDSLWKQSFRDLLDNVNEWFYVGEIKNGSGLEDATHKVVELKKEDGSSYKVQYALKENKNCKLFKLGYTIDEVEELLK